MMNPQESIQDTTVPQIAKYYDKPANTLEESVWVTLWRDIKQIGIKLFYVLIPVMPGKSKAVLRDWDLWGPLLFCLILGFIMSDVAAQIFVIVWIGAGVVTVNASLLGGKISFFQCVCFLGYCVFPLVLAAFVIMFVNIQWTNVWFRMLVCAVAFLWATWASVGFLGGLVPADRKILAVYPVFLFYIVLSWMIVVHFT